MSYLCGANVITKVDTEMSDAITGKEWGRSGEGVGRGHRRSLPKAVVNSLRWDWLRS